MNKKDFDNIKIPTNIDDVIKNAIDKAEEHKKLNNHTTKQKFKRIIPRTAAGFAILLSLGIGTTAVASNIPAIKDVFQRIQNQISASGDYSKYATSINESVTSNGVSVTLSQALCDGENLYVSYIVHSEKPFKYLKYQYDPIKDYDLTEKEASKIVATQLIDDSENKVSFLNEELRNSGTGTLEGEYIDDHTFVGLEQFELHEYSHYDEIPDSFEFTKEIKSFNNRSFNSEDNPNIIEGSWNFKVPINVDKSLIVKKEVINLNYAGIGVKDIKITPIKIIVTLPYFEKLDTLEYDVWLKDENGNYLAGELATKFKDDYIYVFNKENKDPKQLTVEINKNVFIPQENGFKDIGDEIIYTTEIDLTK